MSGVYESQFPEVVRAIEAGHFEENGREFMRAPVDTPRERMATFALERQLDRLLDRPYPRLYEEPDNPHSYSFSNFGVWFIDAIFDLYATDAEP